MNLVINTLDKLHFMASSLSQLLHPAFLIPHIPPFIQVYCSLHQVHDSFRLVIYSYYQVHCSLLLVHCSYHQVCSSLLLFYSSYYQVHNSFYLILCLFIQVYNLLSQVKQSLNSVLYSNSKVLCLLYQDIFPFIKVYIASSHGLSLIFKFPLYSYKIRRHCFRR